MLLRFQGTDFLSAAGSAAKVPSRVGAQQDAVVGQTVKNGSLVMTSNGVPVTSGDSAGHREVPAEASSTAAYYNLGSALLVILLLGVVGMIFYTLRKKVRQSQFATADLGRYEAAYSDPGTPSGSEKGRRVTHHKRGMGSLSKGSSTHQGARSSQEALELERLVQRGDLEHGGGDRKTSVAQEEDVFSLGDSDEDRDGGGPRQRDSS